MNQLCSNGHNIVRELQGKSENTSKRLEIEALLS